jgi:hypothetical protein
VGETPTGSAAQEVASPLGKTTALEANPLGNSPSGSVTQRVSRPVGSKSDHAVTLNSEASPETPTGRDVQRVQDPGSKLPSGSVAQGMASTGQNGTEVRDPVGDTPPASVLSSECQGHYTERVNDPVGNLPIGQDPPELRTPPMNGFDPTPFVPVDKGAVAWREKGSGELRIPHRLYEFAHRVTSTRNELLVFDCLLRFSLGFHRSWCEAGYSFIAAWTGINDITNIKKSLKTLIGAGIVVKAKEHNSASNCGSIYELPVVKGYLEYVATKKDRSRTVETEKYPVGELPTGRLTPGNVTPPAGGQETYGPVGDLPPKKENINKNSKKTLSQERSTDLDAYVDQIKPASKRESEIHFLGKLLSEYSSQDVAMALAYLQRFGVLGRKEECHSPLKYLGSAIEQVLPKAREYQVLLNAVRDDRSTAKGDKPSAESVSAENRLRTIALSAFETELPQAEQDRLLADITRENSVRGYAPPIGVLRGMAALKWFDERNRGNECTG